ncbi:MAG: porin [Polaromonas sp.]|jgi:predicted porin|nr:porin [Polaromonas sp.]
MKFIARKSLLAIAAGLTLASSAFAQTASSVTLYGRLDLAMESSNDGALSKTMLQNYASRFGLKGDRSFNSDLSGIFQVESAFSPEDGKAQNQAGNSGFLASRNSFVGLKSNSKGTILVGNHDTPLKALDGGGLASLLWAQGDAMEVIIHGKGTKTSGSNFDNVHTRQTNNMVYISPKFSDFVVKASYSPDELQTATTNQPLYSVSGEWNNGTYNIGLAIQKKDVADKAFGMSATKLTMGTKMGDFTAGLAFSALDNNAALAANSRKTNNALVVLGYTMGATVFKFNYGMSGESASNARDDLTMTSVEVGYALDKQTTVYGNYAQIKNKVNAKGTFTGSDNFPAVSIAGNDPSALSLGIRYNF